jgi:hypothetical protein
MLAFDDAALARLATATAVPPAKGHHLLRIVGTPAGSRFAIPMFENQFPSCVIAIDHSA